MPPFPPRSFDCPYPIYPEFTLLQRSHCTPSFIGLLWPFVGIASAIVFFAFVVFLLKRFTTILASPVSARYVFFFVSWFIQVSSEALVLASFSSFVAYLQLPIDHCRQANTFNIYSNYMPKSYDGFSFSHIIDSSYSNRVRVDLSNITFAQAIGIIKTGACQLARAPVRIRKTVSLTFAFPCRVCLLFPLQAGI